MDLAIYMNKRLTLPLLDTVMEGLSDRYQSLISKSMTHRLMNYYCYQ
ncbi:MAG: hypothetical protein ACQXXD_07410 [Thermoplasmatota archaeon]